MLKKVLCYLSLTMISTTVFASEVPLDSKSFQSLMNRGETTEAVCVWDTRCGYQTVCEWACLATSMAPLGSWWKNTAAAIAGGKYCGDLCKKVEECKYGYHCDY